MKHNKRQIYGVPRKFLSLSLSAIANGEKGLLKSSAPPVELETHYFLSFGERSGTKNSER
jgi:hypothetical protein